MKNRFIKSTFILFIGGLCTKILSMIIKISLNRKIGIDGVSLYSMILPTFSLFITIGQLGIPSTLSRFVVLDRYSNSTLFFSVIPIYIFFHFILLLLMICFSSFFSLFLLHNSELKLSFIAIGCVIPFTSFSGLFRSYFIGNENMFPCVLSNICENLFRLFFTMYIIPHILFIKTSILISLVILSNVISESIACLILLMFIPRSKYSISFSFSWNYIHDIFHQSIPNIISELIGNVAYFLEPIILTNFLLYFGYSHSYISLEYGVINGYVLPILLLPSFFTYSISQAILPTLTKKYQNHEYSFLKKCLFYLLIFFFLFGILYSFFLFFCGNHVLFLLYHTNFGFSYLRLFSFSFIFYYIQTPMIFFLHSFGKESDLLLLSILSSIVRIGFLIILSLFPIGIYSVIFSIILHIIFTSFLLFYKVYSCFS